MKPGRTKERQMAKKNLNECGCNTCAGTTCGCGCRDQQVTQQTGCLCGEACPCGDECCEG